MEMTKQKTLVSNLNQEGMLYITLSGGSNGQIYSCAMIDSNLKENR